MRLALIGYGGMGKYHLSRISKLKDYEIAGIYDNDTGKQGEARRSGYHIYSSAEELMSDNSVDAVLIATPNDWHCHYALMSANSGKHILCEKPVAMNSAELEQMIDAAVSNNVIFTVNQNRRYDRDYLIIKSIYNSPKLGHCYKVMSNVMGSHGVPGDWRKLVAQGGGMILDWGVHLIDQALQMVEGRVTSVYCRNLYVYRHEVDDGTYIVITFDNGTEYHINIETNAFISLPRWSIYGLEGTAVVKDWLNRGKVVRVKTFFDSKNKGIRAGNGFTRTMADRSRATTIRERLPHVDVDKNAIYNNFATAINGKCQPIVKHDELMRVMRVMESAFESARSNQVIKTNI